MLKNGKTSSNAVPGTVSSTTVQGVLPNYSGYATASLTPTIANSTTPPPRASMRKVFDGVDNSAASNLVERKRENLPPVGAENPNSTSARSSSSYIAS